VRTSDLAGRSDNSDLKGQRGSGGDLELCWGRTCSLPCHGNGPDGRDDRALVPRRPGPKYSAGMLQLEYCPAPAGVLQPASDHSNQQSGCRGPRTTTDQDSSSSGCAMRSS